MGRMEQRPVGGQYRQQRSQYRARDEYAYAMRTYVDGNTARQMQAVPERREAQPRRRQARRPKRVVRAAGQLNLSYVLFLVVASVVVVMACVNYLQLQSENTTLQKSVTRYESELANKKLENDAAYEEMMAQVDLQKIKELAMDELGMVYATQDQIIPYSSEQNDYVRQYNDVPQE